MGKQSTPKIYRWSRPIIMAGIASIGVSVIGLINGISLGAIALLIAQEAGTHLQTPAMVASLPMLLVAGLSLATNGFVIYLLYRHRDRDLNLH